MSNASTTSNDERLVKFMHDSATQQAAQAAVLEKLTAKLEGVSLATATLLKAKTSGKGSSKDTGTSKGALVKTADGHPRIATVNNFYGHHHTTGKVPKDKSGLSEDVDSLNFGQHVTDEMRARIHEMRREKSTNKDTFDNTYKAQSKESQVATTNKHAWSLIKDVAEGGKYSKLMIDIRDKFVVPAFAAYKEKWSSDTGKPFTQQTKKTAATSNGDAAASSSQTESTVLSPGDMSAILGNDDDE